MPRWITAVVSAELEFADCLLRVDNLTAQCLLPVGLFSVFGIGPCENTNLLTIRVGGTGYKTAATGKVGIGGCRLSTRGYTCRERSGRNSRHRNPCILLHKTDTAPFPIWFVVGSLGGETQHFFKKTWTPPPPPTT